MELRLLKRTVTKPDGTLENETVLQYLLRSTFYNLNVNNHNEMTTEIIYEWIDVPTVDERTIKFQGE